ncbi:uncharacterized protein BJ212DRAFT_1415697 [Suillus subaureus]|uniref:Uncharacterized protein n=1 Tax=Suillus subaureus TaxID=48587 RepID=A0A9P7AQ99_9AGAM|nr:uncharacterized protein BJ212DRAFT_1415697 [Suillus subaureus]KAG1793372.1 hypothetical protein BJ212DRAFT_1415697 [Suillus subaureus]
MTGPSSAAFCRSENRGGRRNRDKSGSIRMWETTSFHWMLSCLNSSAKAPPVSPGRESPSNGELKLTC